MDRWADKTKTPSGKLTGFLCSGKTISRILYSDRSRSDDHLSGTTIARSLLRATSVPKAFGTLALAPERVYHTSCHHDARTVAVWRSVKLHPITFHLCPNSCRGSIVSVALSLDLRSERRARVLSFSIAILWPPLTALHEFRVAPESGVRTFLSVQPKLNKAVICPTRTTRLYHKKAEMSRLRNHKSLW